MFILSSCSNMLTFESIFEYLSRDEVFTRLFFFFSSLDEISSQQKRVNSKRHFTIDRDDFVPGRVSSRDEISRVNTLSVLLNFFMNSASRSSRPEVFCKKDVLRNFTKFTAKHLCQSLFFNKVAGHVT